MAEGAVTPSTSDSAALSAIALLHQDKTLREACEEAGLSAGAVLERAARNRRVRERLEAALQTQAALVEDALYETALKGNATAQQFYLCNRAPERWRANSAARSEAPVCAERVTPAELVERYGREDEANGIAVSGAVRGARGRGDERGNAVGGATAQPGLARTA